MLPSIGSRPVSDFVKEAQARVNREIRMPSGTYAVFSGESEARAQSQRDLLAYGGIALVGIALLLFMISVPPLMVVSPLYVHACPEATVRIQRPPPTLLTDSFPPTGSASLK